MFVLRTFHGEYIHKALACRSKIVGILVQLFGYTDICVPISGSHHRECIKAGFQIIDMPVRPRAIQE